MVPTPDLGTSWNSYWWSGTIFQRCLLLLCFLNRWDWVHGWEDGLLARFQSIGNARQASLSNVLWNKQGDSQIQLGKFPLLSLGFENTISSYTLFNCLSCAKKKINKFENQLLSSGKNAKMKQPISKDFCGYHLAIDILIKLFRLYRFSPRWESKDLYQTLMVHTCTRTHTNPTAGWALFPPRGTDE